MTRVASALVQHTYREHLCADSFSRWRGCVLTLLSFFSELGFRFIQLFEGILPVLELQDP